MTRHYGPVPREDWDAHIREIHARAETLLENEVQRIIDGLDPEECIILPSDEMHSCPCDRRAGQVFL